MDFDYLKKPKDLRKAAERADARAHAAWMDNDWADRLKWHNEALRLRRIARELEFAS